MAAAGWQAFLLTVLSLGTFAHPCKTQELRCWCIQTYSDFIPLRFIKSVWLIPEDIYCSRKEVIVLLKMGKLICLDPEAEWVKALTRTISTEKLLLACSSWLAQLLIYQEFLPRSGTALSKLDSPQHTSFINQENIPAVMKTDSRMEVISQLRRCFLNDSCLIQVDRKYPAWPPC
ncbi:Cxcl15 [Phodopus roborovskii]|uniref:Cxcl15 protein n=1 Tax=Phodopus roborovskii TaxID=109678 RepID=A0AAU9ZW87_PHORO|nr:Cxcl15 [Phodopus roborovskii]